MLSIIISNYDRTRSVVLPPKARFTWTKVEVAKTTTMASGKTVKDIIGMRNKVNVTYGMLPAATLAELVGVLESGGFFWVEFPTVSGDKNGYYEISFPKLTTFVYDEKGVASWSNIALALTAQEVE